MVLRDNNNTKSYLLGSDFFSQQASINLTVYSRVPLIKGHTQINKRPRGLDALLELKTQYTRMF